MSFLDLFGQTVSVAVAVERTMEILKPGWLSLKNRIFKKNRTECTKLEKTSMAMLLGIIICLSMHIGIDIPGISEPGIIQEILAGLVSSFGSSVLHTILSILSGVKDTIETRGVRK